MDHPASTTQPVIGCNSVSRRLFNSRDISKTNGHGGLSRSRYGVALGITVVILLMNAGVAPAESPDNAYAEGIASSRIAKAEPVQTGIGKFTMVLLAADGAARALDAYSTVRMLRNRCNGDLSVPVCNEEMFLPDAVTRSKTRIYAYETSAWIMQVVAVRGLSRHHRRLARLVPTLDIATTLPFAVNNLRLPIHVQPSTVHVEWRIAPFR